MINFEYLAINDIITHNDTRYLVIANGKTLAVEEGSKPLKDPRACLAVSLDGKAGFLLGCEQLVAEKATVNRFGFFHELEA